DDLPALLAGEADLHLSAGDEIERVAGLLLGDDDLFFFCCARDEPRGELLQLALRDVLEDEDAAKQFGGRNHSLGTPSPSGRSGARTCATSDRYASGQKLSR